MLLIAGWAATLALGKGVDFLSTTPSPALLLSWHANVKKVDINYTNLPNTAPNCLTSALLRSFGGSDGNSHNQPAMCAGSL